MNAKHDPVAGVVTLWVDKDEIQDLLVALVRAPCRSDILTDLLNTLAEALE